MGAPQEISDHGLPNRYRSDRNLGKCTSRKRDNIVLIDVDSDESGDVVILDVPEFKRKFKKKPMNVIRIDDDDGNGCESSDGAHHSNNGASTSNPWCPKEVVHPSTSAYAAEYNIFGDKGNTPVKFFKSKRTYSGKRIPRNQYGLSRDSEGCSSESDSSDCELMEGPSGKLRDQWEKANNRKRNGHIGLPPDIDDEPGTSGPSHNFHNISAEEGTSQDPQPPGEQSKLKNCSMHSADRGYSGYPQEFSEGIGNSEQVEDFMEMDEELTSIHNHPLQDCAGEHTTLDTEPLCQQDNVRRSYLHHEGDGSNASSSLQYDGDDAFVDYFQKFYETSKASKEDCDSVGVQFTVKTSEAVEDLGDISGKRAQQVNLPQHNLDVKMTNEKVNGDISVEVTKGPCEDVENDQSASFHSQQSAGVISDLKPSSGYGNDAASSSCQNSLITDRQKIKETEEYKHAMEEEWAARQQQLLRQAEEVRRLRNRKKAENLRIMMNERRQKERLEEMRQTLIRGEENLNIKEKYRAEIKKEIRRIETICGDMASLLRYLGVHVSGGPFPSQKEVQIAYKKACLKFHPDRISTSDLRQQVEAEEKFKLISNMKDRFLF